MFTGLSAFPLTPFKDDALDEGGFVALVERLAASDVDSITALGSTGCYPYLEASERARVAHLAVEHADGKPAFVGVGALRTSHVLAHAESAQNAGASALLLAPLSYAPLTPDDVFALFQTLTRNASVPVIVYDNPRLTHFTFSLELYRRIADLPGIASIKIPPVPQDAGAAQQSVQEVRAVIPSGVTIGISGDPTAAAGLAAGCEAWYSAVAGTLPALALGIARAAQDGDHARAQAESDRLTPLWDLFADAGGGLRVLAAAAEHLGLATRSSLPLPIRGLDDGQRQRVAEVLDALG